jgi:hypothetical protein
MIGMKAGRRDLAGEARNMLQQISLSLGQAGIGRRRRSKTAAACVSIAALASFAVPLKGAAAGESRGYVVSWFHRASYSQDGDCPEGLNPNADLMVRNILKTIGKTPEEIDQLMVGFPNNPGIRPLIVNRGRINGQPVNIYQNPASEPDPMVHTVKGHFAYGFNLDGKVEPDDFVDPETNEAGVDNQLFRALGCFHTERAMPPERPSYPAIQWDMTRDQMPAWVIRIDGVEANADGSIKDGPATVSIDRATGSVIRNVSGDPQADMTFHVDSDKRSQNTVRGAIRNGMFVSDIFTFNMVDDPFAVPEYHMTHAKLRLTIKPDGTVKGILGGYQLWMPLYVSYGLPGSTNEVNLSVDAPGIYYALKKMADAEPDSTGQNTAISCAFVIEGIPAFIDKPQDPSKTASADIVPDAVRLH